jgi:hypothetical protein
VTKSGTVGIKLAFLMLTACLALVPCLGWDVSDLKATISKGTRLPLLDASLAPGSGFDQDKAAALFGGTKDHDRWYQIPSLLTHWWSPKSSEFGEGKLAKQEQKMLSGAGGPASSTHSFARYADAQEQWWKWDSAGLWLVEDDGASIRYEYGLEGKTTAVTESEFGSSTQLLDFTVDKKSQKILEVSQQIREVTHIVLATVPITMKTKVSVKAFDWQGNLTDSEEWVSCNEDHGPSKFTINGSLPDGSRRYDMFIEYLKTHGMADRIPEETPRAPEPLAKP